MLDIGAVRTAYDALEAFEDLVNAWFCDAAEVPDAWWVMQRKKLCDLSLARCLLMVNLDKELKEAEEELEKMGIK